MKKILIVTDTWHPQINGAVTMLTKLKKLLEARGNTVEIIHPGLFRTLPLPLYPEIRLAIFPRRRVERLMKKYAPDSILIATEGPLGWAARSVCIDHNIRFITSYQTHFHLYIKMRFAPLAKPALSLLRRFHAPASKTLVTTTSVKEELEKAGFKHLVVLPLGVDTDLFKRNDHLMLPALPKPVFAYFGRIAREKSPEDFLKLPLPGTKLVIGDGPDRKKLEAAYTQHAIFVGYKRGQELVDWLSLCDVLVFPSTTETFGLVIIEALACGIPVAARNVTGPKDIITNGYDGFLDDDLEKAALACLTLKKESCRNTALRYSWKIAAEILENSLVPTA